MPDIPASPTGDPEPKNDVTLTGVAETLLITLAAKAADAATPTPILNDPYATPLLERLEYDFTRVYMTPWQTAGVVVRTRHLDRGTAEFLKTHPRATVVHLACGLDCRAQRLEWGGETRWIDVDLPEVVALRRKVLPTTLPGRDYRLIAGDVTQKAWLDEIPVDRPTVVVMEGLLGYLEEADGRDLLFRLVERFKEGELLFECFGPDVVRSGGPGVIKKLGARLRWGVGDPKALEEIHPRLEMLEAVPFVMAPGVEEMPWVERLTMYLLSWVPRVRDSILLVRLGIGRETGTGT